MHTYKKHIVLALLALIFTFASLGIARMGQEYYCSMGRANVASNRDERGIPLAYARRSIQGTACAPIDVDGQPIMEEGNKIYYERFVVDVVFWYGALAALGIILKKVDQAKNSASYFF